MSFINFFFCEERNHKYSLPALYLDVQRIHHPLSVFLFFFILGQEQSPAQRGVRVVYIFL
jgi:hypothetical protein